MKSIYDIETDPKNRIKYPFEFDIVWKRPLEFMKLAPGVEPKIFSGYKTRPDWGIDPDDIYQGEIADCWLMCAVSILA
jgi:hypothetical protein